MEVPASLTAFLPSVSHFLAMLEGGDPVIRGLQLALASGAVFLTFLVFLATRDILERTRSVTAQLLCILLVALLPIVGFLLYLLLRPARTLRERELAADLEEALRILRESQPPASAIRASAGRQPQPNPQPFSDSEHILEPAMPKETEFTPRTLIAAATKEAASPVKEPALAAA